MNRIIFAMQLYVQPFHYILQPVNTDLSDNEFYSLLREHYLSQMEGEEMEKTKEEKERQEAIMNTLEGKKNEVTWSEKR